jgi:hypothetical protein
MNTVKIALVFVLVLTLAGAGVYVAQNRGWLPAHFLPKQNLTANLGQNTIDSQFLSSQANNISSQIGTVLGSSISLNSPLESVVRVNTTATTSAESIAGRTLEYARYLYCQQVVEEWQKSQP